MPWWHALLLNLALAAMARKKRWLSGSGSVAGFFIGGLIAWSLGWAGWLVLCIFFLGGTAATRFQFEKKRALGVAQEGAGRRRWKHAWANAGAGVGCALAAWSFDYAGSPQWAEAWRWAFVACFAAALSDTLSSEFGQLADQQPWLITTGETVPVGTDGGITRSGILVGILGATVLTLVGRFMGLVPVKATLPVLLAGLSGNLFDSWLGATLQKRGLMDNESVNFSNTLVGASLGLAGYWFMGAVPGWLQEAGWDLPWLLDMFI